MNLFGKVNVLAQLLSRGSQFQINQGQHKQTKNLSHVTAVTQFQMTLKSFKLYF